MAGIEERVQGFLDSWPIVEKQLNELLEEAMRDGVGSINESPRGSEIPSSCRDHGVSLGRE